MKHISKPHPILDGYEKVSGRLTYLDDMMIEGLAHAKLVLSTVAHGRITRIETDAALSVPGVLAVFHHGNTPDNIYNSTIWFEDQEVPEDEHMFPPVVRHVGDRVAAVVAETTEIACEAAALIRVEYCELQAAFCPQAALESETAEVDLVDETRFDYGDAKSVLARADVVVETTVTTPRTHHCAIENHTCVAMPEEGGRILILSPCQSVFSVQMVSARALGIPASQIRVAKPPIGGSFGGKAEPILEPLCAHFARVLGRPVSLSLERHETFTATRTRSGATGRVRTAVNSDGYILARDTDVLIDVGAYTTGGIFLPGSMSQRLCRLYEVDNQRYRGRAVRTNTVPSGAYRGYGSPQIHAISEINLDLTATALGMDPVKFRMKNLIHPHATDPTTGIEVGNARVRDCVAAGAAQFDWKNRWNRTTGRSRLKRGVGMACATHINGCFPGFHEATTATLGVRTDGRIDLNCALHDLGCGSNTTLAQIVAEVLDIPPTDIVFSEVDSDICAYDLGTRASRMTYIAGEAVRRTAERLKARIASVASLEFNCDPSDVFFEDGYVVSGQPADRRISFTSLVQRAETHNLDLTATETYRATANPGSYAAHFVEVEADILTGKVRVLDYLAVHDLGRAINQQLVEGQIHGGVQMGIGYALFEDIGINPDTGALYGDSLSRYHVANAPEMPRVETLLVQKTEPTGPYGAKAVGELATIPVAPAIVNAVNNALGLALTTLPLTPERIVAALETRPDKVRSSSCPTAQPD
ncbi:MAG: molybdopterin-dependent oxidoreductase [Rhodobacteraceae bacterium]|nr:molybdopterin-dependent oxidoreductase [Paracoccaceae bacterium]